MVWGIALFASKGCAVGASPNSILKASFSLLLITRIQRRKRALSFSPNHAALHSDSTDWQISCTLSELAMESQNTITQRLRNGPVKCLSVFSEMVKNMRNPSRICTWFSASFPVFLPTYVTSVSPWVTLREGFSSHSELRHSITSLFAKWMSSITTQLPFCIASTNGPGRKRRFSFPSSFRLIVFLPMNESGVLSWFR